jgi:hypothetical protein
MCFSILRISITLILLFFSGSLLLAQEKQQEIDPYERTLEQLGHLKKNARRF